MSFDESAVQGLVSLGSVSIPFEQGDVFRQKAVRDYEQGQMVSIPFEQGDVFRQLELLKKLT